MAMREKVPMLTVDANRKDMIVGAPLFIVPVGLVVILLMFHFTPGYVALYGMVSLLLIAMLRKETRSSMRDLVGGLTKGANIGASIAVTCAVLGMFTKMMVTIGAAQKLALFRHFPAVPMSVQNCHPKHLHGNSWMPDDVLEEIIRVRVARLEMDALIDQIHPLLKSTRPVPFFLSEIP